MCPHMPPILFMNHMVNSLQRDPILLAKLPQRNFEWNVLVSDINDVLLGKLRHVIGLTSRHSSLLGSICHVVFIRSKKEMVGIYAHSYITSVKNMLTFRNFPIVNKPRKPVCASTGTIVEHLTITTTSGFSMSPNPATVLIHNVSKLLILQTKFKTNVTLEFAKLLKVLTTLKLILAKLANKIFKFSDSHNDSLTHMVFGTQVIPPPYQTGAE